MKIVIKKNERTCEKLMKNDKIVIINGREYDRDTGLPLKKSSDQLSSTSKKITGSMNGVHSLVQKTQSAYSRTAPKKVNDVKPLKRKIGRSMDIAHSNSISRGTSRIAPVSTKPLPNNRNIDIKPIKHPLAANVEKLRSSTNGPRDVRIANKPSNDIKQEAIKEALEKPLVNNQKSKKVKRNHKFINVFSVTIAIIIVFLTSCVIYINIPSISVRVASAQAGINATFPLYHPESYSIDGPVLYADGEVTISFRSNAGNNKFVIKQSKSTWDSSALRIQVDKDSNNETSESKEGGLTIYTYGNNTNAVWVNGGILYTITGDARLSGEQIRHIATSL